MKSWIGILSLLFCDVVFGNCRIADHVDGINSLSGPVTVVLKEAGLLNDPKLKGVSIFHPVGIKEYKGFFLPGGIWISRDLAEKLKGSVIFFDESRELAKVLGTISVKPIEVKTRNLTPLEVTQQMTKLLTAYTQGCEEKFEAINQKAKRLGEEILALLPKPLKAVFFLGAIKGERLPEMAMVNDGAVKWLREKGKLQSYPSELAYVSWSPRMLLELPGETLWIGVVDSGNKLLRSVEKNQPKGINLTFPGSLVPGISQLEAWHYLCSNLK